MAFIVLPTHHLLIAFFFFLVWILPMSGLGAPYRPDRIGVNMPAAFGRSVGIKLIEVTSDGSAFPR
jgi:hypothetical protein